MIESKRILYGDDIIRTLVISDIHGCYSQFSTLLNKVNYDYSEDNLVLLGDYVDRGFHSKEVIEKVIDLVKAGAIALKGNHDQMMIDAFLNDQDDLWLSNNGLQTIRSYIGNNFFEEGFNWDEYSKAKNFIKRHFEYHLEFLNSLPLYHETDNHIFVHAGINPLYENWKEQPEEDFIWIREVFYNNQTLLDKTVIFGHTPTPFLNSDGSANIWFGKDKIGIDGACCYGRNLLCLEISDDGYKQYKVEKGK